MAKLRVRDVDGWLTSAIALVSGVGVAAAGVSPTGATAIDVSLVVVGTAVCVWLAASAPWWAGVAVSAIACALAPTLFLLAVGAVALGVGLAFGLADRSVLWSRAIVVGIAIQVLARLGDIERFGFSSLISTVVLVTLSYLGLRRRPKRDRRIIWIAAGVAAGVVAIAVAGLGISALQARTDLEAGARAAEDAIDLLGDGEIAGARESFVRAAAWFDRADGDLSRPWTQPARLVPVLAQHRNSAVNLVESARQVSGSVATLLQTIDYDSLRVVNGRIDPSSIERIEGPLAELTASIDSLEATVRDAQSPWLVNALSSRLDDLVADIDRQQHRGDDVLTLVRQAPEMLGADGPRVYFIAFTSPVEARGLGGSMGNWAEITLTDGRISLTSFGRTRDLNLGGLVGKKTLSGPEDFLANYGDFLLSDTDAGIVDPSAWSYITTSPDFPAVAQAIAELYPQSGGRRLDGVFVMDVETVARLVAISGPVHLDDLGVDISSANAASFLMRDQYVLSQGVERVDALETVARETVGRLLTSELPAPPDLAELLGPMASQGRLTAWAARGEEQDVFGQLGMTGGLPEYQADGLAITFNNAGGNKIDDLLQGSATYDVRPNLATGTATATLSITLSNTSPAGGLPDTIIGNSVGQPIGTNSTYLSVYSALPFTSATVDGEPYPFSVGSDRGYLLSNALIDIPPGATIIVELKLDGGLDLSDGYSLAVRTPPTARPFPILVTSKGQVLSDGNGGEPGIRRLAM